MDKARPRPNISSEEELEIIQPTNKQSDVLAMLKYIVQRLEKLEQNQSYIMLNQGILANWQNSILANQQKFATKLEKIEASIVSKNDMMAQSKLLMECKAAIKKVEQQHSVCHMTGESHDKNLDEVARMLPLHTLASVQEVEQKLDTPDFAQAMTTYLHKLKGASEDVSSVIRAMFTDDLLQKYNWEGRCDRQALGKLMLFNKTLRDDAYGINTTDCDEDIVAERNDDCSNRQNGLQFSSLEVKHNNTNSPKSCTETKECSQQKCPSTKFSHSKCTWETILKEIGLYDELYDYFERYNFDLDCESLTYMQGKHIDKLCKGLSLKSMIIFEHRLLEWQRRHKLKYEDSVSLEISQRMCEKKQDCHLLSIKNSNGTCSDFHISETNKLVNLPNRLMEVMKSALGAALQEYQTNCEHNVAKRNTPETGPKDREESFVNIELADALSETGAQKSLDLSTKNEKDQIAGLKIVKPSSQIVNNHRLEPSVIYNRKRKWGLETEVREILLMYKSGNILLETYNGFGSLTPEMRTELIHILVDHFVINHEFLSVPQCRKLAEGITELFPLECMDFYFVQEIKNCTPRGKLWDRYQNQRQRQKKTLNALLNPPILVYTKQDWPEMELLCKKLKSVDDEKLLLRKWNKSFHFRRYQLQSEQFTSWKLYFDEYPFCKQPNYSQFIDADLDVLYPNLTFDENLWDEFLNNFKLFYWNRISHAKSRRLFDELISTDDITGKSDYFEIKIIELIHAVLNSAPDIIEEAQRQFTIEVPDLGELKKVVIERKKYCFDNDIQCKPFIAVVGQNRCYEHYSVVLDSTGFSCDSYQESVILCFKLYLFFDLCYTNETLNTWMFIQKYFFNKHSILKNDIVDNFIFDLRSQKQVPFIQ